MNAEGQYYTMPGCGQLYGMTQRMLKIMLMIFLPVNVIVGIVVWDVGGGGMQLHWIGLDRKKDNVICCQGFSL